MRYGRSFYNPEAIWYGYPSYMYKFYVQTSMPKNMVVVDQKMQEPVESFRKLFYTGKMMQATLVETNARWSNPPYGGMQYDYLNGVSFAEKSFDEGRSVDVPKDAPAYGEVTGYTEPVLQRRLMVMTDDYVILSDYLKAEKEHTFDCLFQVKGFKNLQADRKTYLKHVRDFFVQTDLDKDYKNSELSVSAKVKNYGSQPSQAQKLQASLYNGNQPVEGATAVANIPALKPGQETIVALKFTVNNPEKWSAETPKLYTTVLTLQDNKGTNEILSSRTGFRKIEIKGRQVLVNGTPIKLKGVNRHDKGKYSLVRTKGNADAAKDSKSSLNLLANEFILLVNG